jgi:hypothetical protein
MHPDHDDMTAAFMNRNVTFWTAEGEVVDGLPKQQRLEPSVYSVFASGKKSYDLGGGRVVIPFLPQNQKMSLLVNELAWSNPIALRLHANLCDRP